MSDSNGGVFDRFMIALGFEVDTKGAEDYHKKLGEVKHAAEALVGVFTAVAGTILGMAHHTAESLGGLQQFAERNGYAAKQVHALGVVANQNESSMEAMKSSIQGLNNILGQAQLGVGRGAVMFARLGFSARNADGSLKNVDQVLAEVSDKMVGLSRAERIAMAEKLGIDPTLVTLLGKGAANLGKLREEAERMLPFSEHDYELAEKVEKLFNKAKAQFGVFMNQIGVQLLPIVNEVLTKFLEWAKAVRAGASDSIVSALKSVAEVIGIIWRLTMAAVAEMKKFADWVKESAVRMAIMKAIVAGIVAYKLGTWIMAAVTAMQKLIVAAVEFNVATGFMFVLIGLVAAAIGLLIEDFVTWQEGGESAIGSLLKKFPVLNDVIQGVKDTFKAVSEWFMQTWSMMEGPVTEMISALLELAKVLWSILGPVVKLVFAIFGWFLRGIAKELVPIITMIAKGLVIGLNIVAMVLRGIIELITMAIEKIVGFINKAKEVGKSVGKFFGIGTEPENAQAAGLTSEGSVSAPAWSMVSPQGGVLGKGGDVNNNSASTTETNFHGDMNFNITSTDPNDAGQSVKNELQKMQKNGIRNSQSTVEL